jgi:hypothetical protein
MFISNSKNILTTGVHPEKLMGSEIDCQKLASSMTLFEFIAAELDDREFGSSAKNVLKKLAPHGWGRCTKTLNWLKTVFTSIYPFFSTLDALL